MRFGRRLRKLEASAPEPEPEDVIWKTLDSDGTVRELDAAEIQEARRSAARGDSIIITEFIEEDEDE